MKEGSSKTESPSQPNSGRMPPDTFTHPLTQPQTARIGQAIRQAGHPGARGVWRPTGLPQADRRVEGPPPILERRNDHQRPQRHGARDSSLEADLERGSARVGADRRVHIRQRGACAPKRHSHVRASAPVCGCLSYSCGTAAGAATPLRSFRPKKGATPRIRCLDRHRGGLACAHPCHPPPGVAPLQQSLAGRPSSAAASAAYQRIRPPVAAFHQLGGSASRPSEVGVGARPSPKLPRGG